MVEGTLAILRLAGETKYVNVETDLPDREVPVTVNRNRVEQVLINLVGNAADALMEAGSDPATICMVIEGRVREGRVHCRVSGPGIPADRRDAS